MSGIGDWGLLGHLWSSRHRPPVPPITDAELDPSRAPRRNDVAGAILYALPWVVGEFWLLGTRIRWDPTDGLTYGLDLQTALMTALLFALLGPIWYAIRRAMKSSARTRKAQKASRRNKILGVLVEAAVVGLFTFWGAQRITAPDPVLPLFVAVAAAVLGGLVAALAVMLVVDIPAQPYLPPPNIDNPQVPDMSPRASSR